MAYLLLLVLTQNHFTYAISASYIHMSIAKYFITDGILSVDGETYSSASSAPLWMMLISPFYKLVGSELFVYVSALLNVLFQVLSLGIIFKIVEELTNKKMHYIYGLLFVLSTPFVTLTLGGAEHSLQIFLIVWFLYYFILYFNDQENPDHRIKLLLLAPFITFVRYEDFAFIMAMAMLMALYLKDWKMAISLILSGLIFVAIFAFWSAVILGIDPVPTSIMAKSTVGSDVHFFEKFLGNLCQPHIVTLFGLNTAILFLSFKKKNQILFALSLVFIVTLITHLLFGKLGWMYRYEAYLVLFGMLNIVLYHHFFEVKGKWLYFVVIFILLGLSKQIAYSPYYASMSAKKVYEQKIQTANFVSEYYTSSHLTTDNIGTIPYFSNVKVFDIYGLTNPKIIKLKKQGIYTDSIKKELILKRNNEMIIAYSSRFKEAYVQGYSKIVDWHISNKFFPSDSTISFYSRADKLEENYIKLKIFSEKKLSKNVKVVWSRNMQEEYLN
jgi:hypothetical protein